MLVSLAWLRSLCPVDEDVDRIADALTARGLTVDAVSPCGADHTLDIDVPANRPDCLGHLGLARELAAAFGVPLRSEPEAPRGSGGAAAETARVEIEDPGLCRRYTAGLIRGVRVGPSPRWVGERLEACGLRSISNVVDASNLVMLELGNPIHFFDLDRMGGEATIIVRRARPGETLVTLDGEERRIDEETLVIADERRPVALAGVMGGADTEIHDATRDVLVEAAWFDPRSVRATAQKLGMQTDASFRFARGVDPERLIEAQHLAARLLLELAGGSPAPGPVDAYPGPGEPRRLTLRLDQLGRLLGYQPEGEEVDRALEALLLAPRAVDADTLEVTAPSWRVDLEREADLVEEVARHLGYDRVPSHLEGIPASAVHAAPRGVEESVRELLAHEGFHEAYGYAMIGDGDDLPYVPPDDPPALRLTNPIAETLAHLRRSILAGLVRAADLNHRRGNRDVRLFEVGHVFRTSPEPGEFPHEPLRAGLVWSGAARPAHWSLQDRDVDLFDLVGVVDGVLSRLRPDLDLTKEPCDLQGLHPGRSVNWSMPDGTWVARAGALHPDVQQHLAHPLFVAEILLDGPASRATAIARYRPLPRLTAVARDLSLVVTREHSYERIVSVMKEVPPPAPVRIEAVDRYEGPPLAAGEVSLTVRFVLEPSEKTLTDPEIEGYRQSLVELLGQRLGVSIRA